MAYSVLQRNLTKNSVVNDIFSVLQVAYHGNLNLGSKFYHTLFFHHDNKLEKKTRMKKIMSPKAIIIL